MRSLLTNATVAVEELVDLLPTKVGSVAGSVR